MNRFVPLWLLLHLAACSRATVGWQPSLVSQVPDSMPVRFAATSDTPIVSGRALDWQRGSPRVITARGDTVTVPHGAVASVRLPGSVRHAGAGAIIGAVIGIGASLPACSDKVCEGGSPYQLLGAVGGALIGYAIKTDNWVRVTWGSAPR